MTDEPVLTEDDDEDEENPLADIQQKIDEMRMPEYKPGDTPEGDLDRAGKVDDAQQALIQYQIQAEIAKIQKEKFDPNVSFFGTHVVNSNTKRPDNLRHLGEFDSTRMARDIPYMREYATDIKIRTTSEYQMCRSNPEIGGFDRKMQYTNIRRESMDVNQKQQITSGGKSKKGGILSWFTPGKKKEEA
ncbi:MAG TPA: hypothetical protein VMY59_08785 [Candidatus Thermoplasmatota archaeon]|nr:hypothetical protein [Candidatus Thermoplasmatota archaeon]